MSNVLFRDAIRPVWELKTGRIEMQKPCSANVLAGKVLDCMLGIVYFNLKMSMIDGRRKNHLDL